MMVRPQPHQISRRPKPNSGRLPADWRLRMVVAACFAGSLAIIGGCGGKQPAAENESKPLELAEKSTDGAVELRLTVSPAELTAGRSATVTVEAVADARYVVTLSDYAVALGQSEHAYDWRVTRQERQSSLPVGEDRLAWRQTYQIEFLLPGEYELPAATLSYAPPISKGEEGELQTLQTGVADVTVVDAGGTATAEAELRKIPVLDPVELPPRWSRWWWLGPLLAIGAVAISGALIFLLSRWLPALRRWLEGMRTRVTGVAAPAEPAPPAHVWARQRLAELLARDYLTREMFREFHYELSDIVRGYIERRFHVSAPEMTTEEFLAAAAMDGRFGMELSDELGRFLEACDLVKYAAYRPGRAQAEALVSAANEFVDRTTAVQPIAEGNGRAPHRDIAAAR